MNVLIVLDTVIPAVQYGGTERIVWWLGKELVRRGHKLTYLAAPGSTCPFADVLSYDPHIPIHPQIPDYIDFVHLSFEPAERVKKPYLITHHGNRHTKAEFDINTVFVSRNHADRNAAVCYVHNGLDPDEYGPVDWNRRREHLLFLGYAKRPEKNLRDCAYLARKTKNVLAVVGGKAKWFKCRPWLRYKGFLGGTEKSSVINASKALLSPVRWHEPFGIALIEALYFGCPVVGSRYGSLPEVVIPDVGFLSNNLSEMEEAVRHVDRFNPKRCHAYVCDQFSVQVMTDRYLALYAKVLAGETLNPRPPVNGGDFTGVELLPINR